MDHNSIEQFSDRSYPGRLFVTVIIGAVIALCLTWFMHQLIHSSTQRLDESDRTFMMGFVRLKRNESSAKKQFKPARPIQPDAPPTPFAPMSESNATDTILAVSAMPSLSNTSLNIGGPGFGGTDGDYLPIVKVAPMYPRYALVSRVEGECVVSYTVTTTGATRNIRVIEDRCVSKHFHRASINAASKFKYKPRIIDGEAVEVHDVLNRFVFNIKN